MSSEGKVNKSQTLSCLAQGGVRLKSCIEVSQEDPLEVGSVATGLRA